ncbi:uncharacterized protein [Centruroides vittatus]|uniref:uncharacterized protein n=1 Tax=Centruroides vittatus TaxID=120091 RepID=UPI0035108A56
MSTVRRCLLQHRRTACKICRKKKGRRSKSPEVQEQKDDKLVHHYAIIQNVHDVYFPPEDLTRPILPGKVVISWTGEAKLYVFDEEVKSLVTENVEKLRELICELSSEYLFCPGISRDEVGNYPNLVLKQIPFVRYHSKDCYVWYKRENSKRQSLPPKAWQRQICKMCPKCSKCLTNVRAWHKRRAAEGESSDSKRTAADSKYSFSKLSDEDKEKKLQNLKKSRLSAARKVKRIVKRLQEFENKLHSASPNKMISEKVDENTIIEEIMDEVNKELDVNEECMEEFVCGAENIMMDVENELNKVLLAQSRRDIGIQCNLIWSPVQEFPAIRILSATDAETSDED